MRCTHGIGFCNQLKYLAINVAGYFYFLPFFPGSVSYERGSGNQPNCWLHIVFSLYYVMDFIVLMCVNISFSLRNFSEDPLVVELVSFVLAHYF
jgi:hypothetical protein